MLYDLRPVRRYFWRIALILLLVVVSGYALARPYLLRWGASDQELAMPLLGDASIPTGAGVSTRAVTIYAPAATVWAWLVQTGQNRGGGWHSYHWLENLFAAEMNPDERLDPRWQQLQVGDPLFFHTAGASSPAMVTRVTAIEPGRTLVLGQERHAERAPQSSRDEQDIGQEAP